jgi:hypothetical protein
LVLTIFLERVFHTDYDKQAFDQEEIDALFCHAVGDGLSFLRSKGRWECNPDVGVFVFVACESNIELSLWAEITNKEAQGGNGSIKPVSVFS